MVNQVLDNVNGLPSNDIKRINVRINSVVAIIFQLLHIQTDVKCIIFPTNQSVFQPLTRAVMCPFTSRAWLVITQVPLRAATRFGYIDVYKGACVVIYNRAHIGNHRLLGSGAFGWQNRFRVTKNKKSFSCYFLYFPPVGCTNEGLPNLCALIYYVPTPSILNHVWRIYNALGLNAITVIKVSGIRYKGIIHVKHTNTNHALQRILCNGADCFPVGLYDLLCIAQMHSQCRVDIVEYRFIYTNL